jgi:hypothetical protein
MEAAWMSDVHDATLSRPHGEEPAEAKAGVSNHEAASPFETPPSAAPRGEADRKTLRWLANMLSLWALCGKPACRRALTCRRDPDVCLARYAALVPQAAGSAVIIMAEGKRQGLSYDALRAQAPDEIAALEDWWARTAGAVCRPAAPAP